MAELDIHQIKNYLPHRYPFLLVDRVLEVKKQESITALKNVTVNEPFFDGHFPELPVMPGVLIMEALAQTAAVMASYGEEVDPAKRVYYFTGIDKARFKQPVVPGDQLLFEVSLIRRIKSMWKCDAKAKVDGKVVASAELMFTIKDI